MPGATGVVQEAGVPARPAISTRQRRQEPKASTESVAQSLGTFMPASMAARMIEVPAGTVTVWPSIVSRTSSVARLRGVPSSVADTTDMTLSSLCRRCREARIAGFLTVKIFGEMLDGAHHRI